ncbi:hypothetical protein NC653_041916 [Populus alba x Populus x berolinensis]|uniref:Uncharacterized protein n=1 Tax=Populus alba x Populus x berolinensis TaxID=444605 RepID=A0AAD6L9S5_9ROSI|nr:hypothetical protein NC653_041916 [Populus alba x Populus x berolinensis]
MELLTFLSTNINNFYSQKKKFLVSDAVSDYIRSPFDLTKKFIGSDAVSDVTHNLSDQIKKFLASETVVDVLRWLKKESVPIMVAVVVIALLFGGCCGGAAKSVKTMKAPGRNYRMPRSDFEANPSAYFRGLRKG